MKPLLDGYLETTEFTLNVLQRLKATFTGAVADSDAIASIRRYQTEKPEAAKSIWLDDSLIRAVVGHPVDGISGIRLYYARYTFGSGVDNYTVFAVLTQNTAPGVHTDKPNNYYDYGQPCPPAGGCNGGLAF